MIRVLVPFALIKIEDSLAQSSGHLEKYLKNDQDVDKKLITAF